MHFDRGQLTAALARLRLSGLIAAAVVAAFFLKRTRLLPYRTKSIKTLALLAAAKPGDEVAVI
jgi:hypothetical protein